MNNKTRIVIADDHAVVREGLKAILSFEGDFTVVGEAANGQDAVRCAKELLPDVIVMDLMMPQLNGADATAQIVKCAPSVKVLILTTYGSANDISRAIDAGATGALMKTVTNKQLADSIRKVAAGEKVMAQEIVKSINGNQPVADLTARQLEILHSVARGLTNEDIAKQLGISTNAIKHHLSTIFAKIGAANRAEATNIAMHRHLLKAQE
jgi:NarL family two-component system response regulator LiaR